MLNPVLYSEGRRTLGKEVVVSQQVTGAGGLFCPIHQTGADLVNEAKASLTDKNPILAREKRRWGWMGAESGRSGRKNGKGAPSLRAAPWSPNTRPRRVRCRATSNFTHSNCSSVFSMDALHFPPFTHEPTLPPLTPTARLPFMQLFAVYCYTEIPLCRRHTLFRKVTRAQSGGESVSVLYISESSLPSPRAAN